MGDYEQKRDRINSALLAALEREQRRWKPKGKPEDHAVREEEMTKALEKLEKIAGFKPSSAPQSPAEQP